MGRVGILIGLVFGTCLLACSAHVRIASEPARARILIDGTPTERQTPDEVSIKELTYGEHAVSVAFDDKTQTEAQIVRRTVSVGRIVSSVLFPPLLVVNLIRGFTVVEPQELSFARPSAVAVPPPAAPVVASLPLAPPVEVSRPRLRAAEAVPCAALPLKTASVSEAMGSIIDELLLTALQEVGFQPIGRDDLGAMLDFDRQRDAVDCSDSTCIAEIGNALGVPYLVSGSTVMVEGNVVVTLKLIDVRATRVMARTSQMAEGGESTLPEVLRRAASDLAERSQL